MSRKPYPTDLTDQQWYVIKSLLPPYSAGGHPRTVDMRYILNAIFYILNYNSAIVKYCCTDIIELYKPVELPKKARR